MGGRGREIRRDDVAACKAILDDLDVAHIRGEERLHLGAVNGREERDLVRDLPELGEKIRCKDIALPGHQRDKDAIGAAELALVFHKRPDVRMAERQGFVETRIDVQPQGKPAHDHGESGKDRDQGQAEPENPSGEFFEHARSGLGQDHRAGFAQG